MWSYITYNIPKVLKVVTVYGFEGNHGVKKLLTTLTDLYVDLNRSNGNVNTGKILLGHFHVSRIPETHLVCRCVYRLA